MKEHTAMKKIVIREILTLWCPFALLVYASISWFFWPFETVMPYVFHGVEIGNFPYGHPATLDGRIFSWLQWFLTVIASAHVWLAAGYLLLACHRKIFHQQEGA
jgi:hypothetical protein